MLNEGNDRNNSYDHLEWLFCHFLPFLKDSKIDLLDSASAVKKKLNKVSFNSTCSFIYFFYVRMKCGFFSLHQASKGSISLCEIEGTWEVEKNEF